MPIAAKVSALMSALTRDDVDALPPFERRRFADLCRHFADLAERADRPKPTAAGVLTLLDQGDRAP